jgi:hypothetical protein
MLDHSCQMQGHKLADRGHDLYETPTVAVEALLRVESLPYHLWEPAAGRGAIVNVLRAAGHAVIASDLIDYLEDRGLARVHVFRKRLPMMHRAGWQGRKANSGMAFAWFVWDRGHIGPAAVNRISWDR